MYQAGRTAPSSGGQRVAQVVDGHSEATASHDDAVPREQGRAIPANGGPHAQQAHDGLSKAAAGPGLVTIAAALPREAIRRNGSAAPGQGGRRPPAVARTWAWPSRPLRGGRAPRRGRRPRVMRAVHTNGDPHVGHVLGEPCEGAACCYSAVAPAQGRAAPSSGDQLARRVCDEACGALQWRPARRSGRRRAQRGAKPRGCREP